ncbi:MAG: DUF5679 domain-containing protein [Anaerolineae bacterium]
MQFEGYCVKQRKKTTAVNGKEVTTKNGRRAMKGTCSECGTTMFKFIASK